jgi:predicted transglutaminase-like cysteine proteinase
MPLVSGRSSVRIRYPAPLTSASTGHYKRNSKQIAPNFLGRLLHNFASKCRIIYKVTSRTRHAALLVCAILSLSACTVSQPQRISDYRNITLQTSWDNHSIAEQAHRWVQERIQYKADDGDYWQKPEETIARGKGDCEDLAILKRAILLNNGYGRDQLKLRIGKNKNNILHAILEVTEENGDIWYLDNEYYRPTQFITVKVKQTTLSPDHPIFKIKKMGDPAYQAYVNSHNNQPK